MTIQMVDNLLNPTNEQTPNNGNQTDKDEVNEDGYIVENTRGSSMYSITLTDTSQDGSQSEFQSGGILQAVLLSPILCLLS